MYSKEELVDMATLIKVLRHIEKENELAYIQFIRECLKQGEGSFYFTAFPDIGDILKKYTLTEPDGTIRTDTRETVVQLVKDGFFPGFN